MSAIASETRAPGGPGTWTPLLSSLPLLTFCHSCRVGAVVHSASLFVFHLCTLFLATATQQRGRARGAEVRGEKSSPFS